MSLSQLLLAICAGFAATVVVSAVIVATRNWHARFSADNPHGIQKVHKAATPRIGGIALITGGVAGLFLLSGEAFYLFAIILCCSLPAFSGGLVEDITKSVSPRVRLTMALTSGALFVAFSGTLLPLALPLARGSAEWVSWMTIAMGTFGIAVGLAGTTNSINIIDGFHGLAAGSVIIMTLGIALLAHAEGDITLTSVSLVFAGVVAGFLVVNFPGGHLFLGDAGAYFCGFFLGALAVFLAARTDQSALVSILIMAHPVYETLFSIRRKSKRKGSSPTEPDNLHLHHMVSRRYARFMAFGLDRPDLRNPLTGALMWPFSLVAVILAVFAQGTSVGAVLGLMVFVVFYGRIYRVVSLQRPSFLRTWSKNRGWDEGDRYLRRKDEGK